VSCEQYAWGMGIIGFLIGASLGIIFMRLLIP
jgi:uncharacterized membrane-anchored protein YhcB (DUF1043 family)